MKRKTGFILLLLCMLIFSTAYEATAKRGTVVRLKKSDSANAPFAKEVELYTSSHALVIGIDAYTHWPRLTNAVKDAKRVAKVLEAMDFEVDLQKNLKSSDLEKVLKSFFIRKGNNKNARLFVWFAGHGHTIEGEGFIVPVDAASATDELLFMEKALAMRRFGSFMRFAKSKHVYAVFDSCFSGSIFAMARSRPPAAITQATTKPVRQYLSSGDAEQQVSDDGAFRELFISALKGEEPADANKDGYLTASELGMFLTDRVTNLTDSKQSPRYGKMRDIRYDQGDFVFVLDGRSTIDDIKNWGKWQQERDKEFQMVKKIDANNHIDAEGKVAAWRSFEATVANDNPFSQDDNKMRTYAQTRISYWNKYTKQALPKKDSSDKSSAYDLKKVVADEVDRDGHFIAYNNGTVIDTKTGLMWAAQSNVESISSWSDAKKYCENFERGGYKDWRLPTIAELESIYDSESSYPADCFNGYKIYTTKLIHISCWYVWASDINGSLATDFFFGRGYRHWVVKSNQGGGRVLPVRGGRGKYKKNTSHIASTSMASTAPVLKETNSDEITHDGRFVAYNNGTVKDTKTELIWSAKDNGKDIDWKDAKKYCETYKGGGYTDWRLPSIEELEELYDSSIKKKYKITKLITLTLCFPWASNTRGSEAAYFGFNSGDRYWSQRSNSNDGRVLPVREGK